jgi:hypothetical protein
MRGAGAERCPSGRSGAQSGGVSGGSAFRSSPTDRRAGSPGGRCPDTTRFTRTSSSTSSAWKQPLRRVSGWSSAHRSASGERAGRPRAGSSISATAAPTRPPDARRDSVENCLMTARIVCFLLLALAAAPAVAPAAGEKPPPRPGVLWQEFPLGDKRPTGTTATRPAPAGPATDRGSGRGSVPAAPDRSRLRRDTGSSGSSGLPIGSAALGAAAAALVLAGLAALCLVEDL